MRFASIAAVVLLALAAHVADGALSASSRQRASKVVKNALLAAVSQPHVSIEQPGDLCDKVVGMGYPCEHLQVTTMDGFVLDTLHIKKNVSGNGKPVVLQHGLVMTAETYLGNDQGNLNLATILADDGYDVYLPNSRGNHYSLTNINFPTRNSTFWRMVDFDEMAAFDVPAVIDFVLARTGESTLTWVGHSQGTAMMFAGMSTSARAYASKINLFVALAPVAYVGNTTSELLKVAADLKVGEKLLDDLGIQHLLEDDFLLHDVADLCPDLGDECAHLLGMILGYGNMSNFAPKIYPEVTKYTPGGTSLSNLIHWAQLARTSKFQMHDFGATLNQEYYHQATPPQYKLTEYPATLPTVLVAGGKDALADPKDVVRLVNDLPASAVIDKIYVDNYAHMDPVWGLDAHYRIYPRIVQLIGQYSRGN